MALTLFERAMTRILPVRRRGRFESNLKHLRLNCQMHTKGRMGARGGAGSGSSVFLVEEFVVDIGPELFEEGRSPIDRKICHPKIKGFAKGAFLAGIVKGGDA